MFWNGRATRRTRDKKRSGYPDCGISHRPVPGRRVLHGKGAEEQRIDEGEDREIGSDSQRDGDTRHQGEPRRPAKGAKREAGVLEDPSSMKEQTAILVPDRRRRSGSRRREAPAPRAPAGLFACGTDGAGSGQGQLHGRAHESGQLRLLPLGQACPLLPQHHLERQEECANEASGYAIPKVHTIPFLWECDEIQSTAGTVRVVN